MSDNGFEGNASHIYPRIVQPALRATSDRDKLCQIISEAVGGWNQNTQAITRVADALTAAGYGLVADAKREALERAAEDIDWIRPEMGPGINITQYREGRNDALTSAATWLRARAAGMRQG